MKIDKRHTLLQEFKTWCDEKRPEWGAFEPLTLPNSVIFGNVPPAGAAGVGVLFGADDRDNSEFIIFAMQELERLGFDDWLFLKAPDGSQHCHVHKKTTGKLIQGHGPSKTEALIRALMEAG